MDKARTRLVPLVLDNSVSRCCCCFSFVSLCRYNSQQPHPPSTLTDDDGRCTPFSSPPILSHTYNPHSFTSTKMSTPKCPPPGILFCSLHQTLASSTRDGRILSRLSSVPRQAPWRTRDPQPPTARSLRFTSDTPLLVVLVSPLLFDSNSYY